MSLTFSQAQLVSLIFQKEVQYCPLSTAPLRKYCVWRTKIDHHSEQGKVVEKIVGVIAKFFGAERLFLNINQLHNGWR